MYILHKIIKSIIGNKNNISIQQKITQVSANDGFTFLFDGDTVDILKNNKDYFDGEIVLKSKNNQFMLLSGYKGDVDSVALITNNRLLAIKTDCYFDFGYVSENGVAVISSDGENIVILSENKKTTRQINFTLEKEYSILNEDYCIFAEYDTVTLNIKSVDMKTLKISSYQKEFEDIESDDITLFISKNILNVTFDSGKIIKFDLTNGIKILN